QTCALPTNTITNAVTSANANRTAKAAFSCGSQVRISMPRNGSSPHRLSRRMSRQPQLFWLYAARGRSSRQQPAEIAILSRIQFYDRSYVTNFRIAGSDADAIEIASANNVHRKVDSIRRHVHEVVNGDGH